MEGKGGRGKGGRGRGRGREGGEREGNIVDPLSSEKLAPSLNNHDLCSVKGPHQNIAVTFGM